MVGVTALQHDFYQVLQRVIIIHAKGGETVDIAASKKNLRRAAPGE
jgi:hypothetical protein